MSLESYKLGKLPAKHDPRTLKLSKYLDTTQLPPIPNKVDWSKEVKQWPMALNDKIGDCTIAGASHLIQSWTTNEKSPIELSDSIVQEVYSIISGYNPITGENDNGCYLLDVLKYWQNTGIGGHKIGAYVKVNPKNINEVVNALYLFGGIYIGVTLPVSAQRQTIWDVVDNDGGVWGGHCVLIIDANKKGQTEVVTWGDKKTVTWNFLDIYCDEMYAIVSDDWVLSGLAPNGLKLEELLADLKVVQA